MTDNSKIKTKPHAPLTTLRACIHEQKRYFKKEALIKLGKSCADAYHIAYGKRPLKIEMLEGERIFLVAVYPKKFKKVIYNLINQQK